MGGKDEKEKVQKERVLKRGRKKSKNRKATPRERRYVKGVIAGKTMTQAAREAGYAETTSLNAREKIESKPTVQALFVELMEKAGITDEKLAGRLKEGLDAKETKFFQKDGLVTDSRDVIAHGERRAHLEIALKIKGHLKDKVEISPDQKLGDLLSGIWDGEK